MAVRSIAGISLALLAAACRTGATDAPVTLAPPASAIRDGRASLAAHPDPLSLLVDGDRRLAANKRLVFDMWRGIVNAGHVELADDLLAQDYIQHSPVISTGREAFRKVFSTVKRVPVPDLVSPPLVTILAEGDLVVMALREELPGPAGSKAFATTHFNLFRVADGRLAEHWHSVELPPGPTVPPPEEGGPQRVVGVTGTGQTQLLTAAIPVLAANKRLAFDAWRSVFVAGQRDAALQLIAPDYVEHDPNYLSGRDALLRRTSGDPGRAVLPYIEQPVVAIVAEEELVVLVTAREHPHPVRLGETYTTTGFDMFRIENGQVAEHWSGNALLNAPAPVYG